MEKQPLQLLREPEIPPSKAVLKNALGRAYDAFEELETRLTQPESGLTFTWHYYKDSKAWLCKVARRKKTIFWLSAWEGYFRTNFYFLKRHMDGIAALGIAKNSFILKEEWGKMIPVTFNIRGKKQFPDLLKMINFKKEAK